MPLPVLFKDPAAELDYAFDWDELGWLAAGETIALSSWTIPAGLTQITAGIVGGVTTVWVSGGVVGTDYTIVNQITTSAGRTDQRSIVLKVRER